MEQESEIWQLKSLLDELRLRDEKLRVFGANGHRHKIGPPLSEGEIAAFEAARGIRLPEDFRLYLQIVGDGGERPVRSGEAVSGWESAGAGPGYGVYALEGTWSGPSLREPFPFAEAVRGLEEPPFDASEGDVPGALEVCTFGCSSHAHLIVAGPQRGAVWEGHDYDSFAPAAPSFVAWVRAWAERSLGALEREAKLARVQLGMTREEVEAAVGGEWKEHENSYSQTFYLAAAGFSAQLLLDGTGGVVREVKLNPFL